MMTVLNLPRQERFRKVQMWCHTHYPTSEEYTGVLRLLVDKYSVLKDKFGNGIVILHHTI